MDTPIADPASVGPALPAALELPAVQTVAPRARVRDIAGLFAICALADICLYGRTGGAGQAFLLVAVPAILFLAARSRRRSLRFVGVAALMGMLAARLLWQSSGGTVVLGISALVAFAVALRVRKSYLPELLVSAAASLVKSFGSLWRLGRGAVCLARPQRLFGGFRWVPVVAPIAVVVVFAGLFSAANPVVEDWTTALWSTLAGSGDSFTPLRALLWAASALVAALLLEPVLREPAWNERLGPGHALEATDAVPGAMAQATARNVLVAANVLFLVFNALDATYLWAGQLPPGIGYTEYAHRGATWLTISLAVSTVVLGLLFRGPMSFAAGARRVRILGYAWAAQNLVLGAATLRRLTLYVDHSGLTKLLLLGFLGSLLVCSGLCLIVIKLARRRTGLWLVRRQLDALAIALVVFAVTPTEAIAGWFNAGRIEGSQYRPLLHVFKQPLTAEGVPALASLLDHPNPVIRRGVAGLLLLERDRLAADQRRSASWTEWEGSRSHALGVLGRARPRIAAEVSSREAGQAIEALRKLAFRCRSSVAKPIVCDPPPAGWDQPPRTPLQPVQLRRHRGDGRARVK
jgi:hypothetical protein